MTPHVALVNFYHRLDEFPTKLSLATMRLAAAVLETGTTVRLQPLPLAFPPEDATSLATLRDATLIGLPAYLWTEQPSRALAWGLSTRTAARLVVGGPQTPFLHHETWPENTVFVSGEGEDVLRSLAETTRGESRALAGARPELSLRYRPVIPRETALYSEAFLEVLPELDTRFTWYDTVVGCPHSCGYCGHRTRPDVAPRDDEQVLEELGHIGRHRFQRLYVVDPIFGGSKRRGQFLLRALEEHAPDTRLTAYYRPEFLDVETRRLLGRRPVEELLIGVQSTNPDIPSWVRGNDLDAIRANLPPLRLQGTPFRVELIVGLPGDTMAGLRESLRFVVDDVLPTTIRAYHLTVIPGTPVARLQSEPREGFWIAADPVTRRARAGSTYSEHDLDEMLVFAGAVTSLYNISAGARRAFPRFDELDAVVRQELATASEAARSAWRSGEPGAARDHWRGRGWS